VEASELAGTVTFLLTDIVGSTQLWEQDAAAMAAAMVVHDGVIDAAVIRCGGAVVRPRARGIRDSQCSGERVTRRQRQLV
jgi:class 3 adenylate cyclase